MLNQVAFKGLFQLKQFYDYDSLFMALLCPIEEKTGRLLKKRFLKVGQWLVREAVHCFVSKLVKSSSNAEGSK